MKNLSHLAGIVLTAVVAFCINGCDKNETDIHYDITGDWKVISYCTPTVITKTEENTWSQYNNGDVTISFTRTDQNGGDISGIRVINTFASSYVIDNKGAITISDFFQTTIYEPEWGRLFDSIAKAESYEVRDNLLIIYYSQKKKNITLEKLTE